MKISLVMAVLTVMSVCPAFADNLTETEKSGVCKAVLGKLNANDPTDYTLTSHSGDTFSFRSSHGYAYSCEVFGLTIKLSSPGWQRIQPTGNVVPDGSCIKFTVYDPGFMVTHEGRFCG
ncbi:hypothetical protein EDC28_106142 [Gallaecimonas pentaromativorans]|uniref:Uncharacterized protein n=1 Tax=Gallaecimonas pentaromativorans TaxID=584787 RepID=A0A3N1P8L8_9GAMM|nr:hypothetical protein EDC28_106142 [Gallaecimonas pentaromativorans]